MFSQQVASNRSLPEESIPSFWNPSRGGVKSAPLWFSEPLEKFDPELRCVWNAYDSKWQIFSPSERIKHPIARGWMLLVRLDPSEFREGNIPLIIAGLFARSARRGESGAQYFDRIVSEAQRDQEKAKKATFSETQDMMMDKWESTQIGSHRSGSNFSTYLS